MFNELRKFVPKADLNNPRAMLRWLDFAAGEDPKGATRPAYGEAYGALTEWAAATDLSERLLCERSTVTRLVDYLEGEGLVHRVADPEDRRLPAESGSEAER